MTGRLPFDPSKMSAAKASRASSSTDPSKASTDEPWSVSQLSAQITSAIATGLPTRVRVVGEISGPRERTHWYFSLKDANAVIQSVMFASAAKRCSVPIREGSRVIASGRVEHYAAGGKLSLIVDSLKPDGEGELEAAFRELCDRLRAEGWFDPEHKRPLPRFPRAIAVVTSRSAAALEDVKDTIRRRCPAIEIVLVDVRVQGEAAVREIARGIRRVSQHADSQGIDAVLVTRGGGSREDLWAFNGIEVARAIRECRVPVVAAIGHETDTTVAELVADERCATPTQAAMRLTPDREALDEQLSAIRRRLAQAATSGISQLAEALKHLETRATRSASEAIRDHRSRVLELAMRTERQRPSAQQQRRRARLEMLAHRLHAAASIRAERDHLASVTQDLDLLIAAKIDEKRRSLASSERTLTALSPAGVLSRGYSITMHDTGGVIRHADAATPGSVVRTITGDGEFRSRVETAGADAPASPTDDRLKSKPSLPRSSGARRLRKAKPTDHGPTLFGGE